MRREALQQNRIYADFVQCVLRSRLVGIGSHVRACGPAWSAPCWLTETSSPVFDSCPKLQGSALKGNNRLTISSLLFPADGAFLYEAAPQVAIQLCRRTATQTLRAIYGRWTTQTLREEKRREHRCGDEKPRSHLSLRGERQPHPDDSDDLL
jgi:hypothetical protein